VEKAAILPLPFEDSSMEERRKFERVALPKTAKIDAELPQGKKLGPVRMLGRGGFQVETKKKYKVGDKGRFVLIEKQEDIRREVRAVVRNVLPGGLIGFEFENLDADAAVEVGVLMGKYYALANRKAADS
jgi:PilZ domain